MTSKIIGSISSKRFNAIKNLFELNSLDSWLESSERVSSPETYLETLAASIKEAKRIIKETNSEDPQCVIFCCSPMDEEFTKKFAGMIDGKIIDNTRFLSHDIQAVMKLCGLLMGMRFHSLVLSSGVGTPIVGLVYAPKVRGYMRYLECEEYSVELNTITPEHLGKTLAKAWLERQALQERQQNIVRTISAGARKASIQLVGKFFPNYKK